MEPILKAVIMFQKKNYLTNKTLIVWFGCLLFVSQVAVTRVQHPTLVTNEMLTKLPCICSK